MQYNKHLKILIYFYYFLNFQKLKNELGKVKSSNLKKWKKLFQFNFITNSVILNITLQTNLLLTPTYSSVT